MVVEAISETQAVKLSPFQEKVLLIPETHDLFLGGGRGGGKSYCLALLALRHAEQYGSRARILYLRQSYPGVADFEQITRELFGQVYGLSATYNGSSHSWRLPGGGYFELNQLESDRDYTKFQGRSFTLILIDEAGQWSDPTQLDKLRSNLRGPEGVPVRMVYAANPGQVGHAWLSRRFVLGEARDWEPFTESQSGRTMVRCPSTYLDNIHLNAEEYRRQLEASTTDEGLARAWISGDWSAVQAGAFFASVLSEENMLDPWLDFLETPEWYKSNVHSRTGWWRYLSFDWGFTAPSVALMFLWSPGGHGPDQNWYSTGSLVVVDELAIVSPNSLTEGLQWPVSKQAESVKEFGSRWGMRIPRGVADDGCFQRTGHSDQALSIADQFMRHGVEWSPARKGDRPSGWALVRQLLHDAGQVDRRGLYISRSCEYLWQTLPFVQTDPRRREDVDTRSSIDHGIDSLRYGCIRHRSSGRPAIRSFL